MADLSLTPVGAGIKPMQGMSLAEMINAAGAAQAYQQASQLNPVILQRAEAELQRLRQLMPEELAKAQAEAKVAKETETPRIETAKSAAETAASGAEEARLKVLDSFLKYVRPEIADLIKEPEITYQDIKTRLEKTVNNATDNPKLRTQLMAQGLQDIPDNLSSNQYREFLANSLVKTVGAENQLAARFPAVSLTSTGAEIVPVTSGGALAVISPGQKQPGGVKIQPAPLPAGSKYTPTGRMDVTGQHEIYAYRDEQGNLREVSVKDIPPAELQKSGVSAPMRPPPGQTPEMLKVHQAETQTARERVVPAKAALDNIAAIKNSLPKAATGSLSDYILTVQSLLGNVAGSTEEEKAAAARDKVGKYLSDLAILKNITLGGKYAGDLQATKDSLTTVKSNPTAIRESLEDFAPFMLHAISYANGLDAAINKNPENFYIKPKFDQAMNEAFDKTTLKYLDILRSDGPAALQESLTKNNVSEQKREEMFYRIKRYQALENGDLDKYNQELTNYTKWAFEYKQKKGKK